MVPADPGASTEGASSSPWLMSGVWDIGVASLLSDLGHEVPSALLPAFLAPTLGEPPAVPG